MIVLASDHAGFALKRRLLAHLEGAGHACRDLGVGDQTAADYPDLAHALAAVVAAGEAEIGVLVCGTGIGMSMAANRHPGVRAALCHDPFTAEMARRHNDANVLCLGARTTGPEAAQQLVDLFLATPFEGGRHQRRVDAIEVSDHDRGRTMSADLKAQLFDIHNQLVAAADPPLAAALEAERRRQNEGLELIASENFVSPAVLAAMGSVMTNKYAEGYPGKRYYGGCQHVDVAEELARERAKQLFGAEHANVQPHSGAQANMSVYLAVLKPGDTMLGMDLSHGGHLTHGHPLNYSGKEFKVVPYGVRRDTETIDYDRLRELALENRPRLIVCGASAYPRTIDFPRLRAIADEAGALLMADIAHIAGLVAAGLHPSPFPHCHFVTSTTHKTLRGPRGGLILCGAEHAEEIDKGVFPGVQGGPLMHCIAAKAVAFAEALRPEWKEYQQRIVANAQALCQAVMGLGWRVVSGGTDNHLFLIDLGKDFISGKKGERWLGLADITVNKNTVPFDTRKPFIASGLRIGTPAVTTRGMGPEEMRQVAALVDRVLRSEEKEDDPAVMATFNRRMEEVAAEVHALTARFPLY